MEFEHPVAAVSRTLTEGNYFIDENWIQQAWTGLDLWLQALAQFLSACTWSQSMVAAMTAKAPRPPDLFGLIPSSLAARALELLAPRFADWALNSRRPPANQSYCWTPHSCARTTGRARKA